MLRLKSRGNNGVTRDGLCDVIMQIPLTMNERNSRQGVSRSQGRERRHEAYGAPLVIQKRQISEKYKLLLLSFNNTAWYKSRNQLVFGIKH